MAGIVAIAGTVLPQVLAFSIPDNPAQRFALGCAAISLLISLLTGAVVVALRGRQQPGAMVTVGHVAALLSGVAAAIVQAIVLVMRVVYVCVDLTSGVPWRDVRAYGFGTGGLWTVGLLVAACAVSWRSTRDGRLAACQFWTAVLFVAWAALLSPVLHRNTSGGYERSAATLITFAALCALLLVASLWSLRFGDKGSCEAGEDEADESPEESQAWPGFRASCTALAVLLTVLTCYHLLVPIRTFGGGFRPSALMVTGSVGLAGLGCFMLVRKRWSRGMADAAMGLASLGLCALATVAVPSHPAALSDRYPMVFNAMMVGLATATALWTWIAGIAEGRIEAGTGSATTRQLVSHAKRFSFTCGALALIAAAMMTLWPSLPGIATMDHSYGRITAGFAANLFLLLVLLWSARRIGRLTFQLLTMLSVVSTIGFLVMRMMPFVSHVG